MIILILGNNYCALSFYKLFSLNNENIIFSTLRDCKNYIEFDSNSDIVDFCEANDINFVLITENNYIDSTLNDEISNLGISVFSPSREASEICLSKFYAKKFMYKNRIKTPKFQVIEKPQVALDYISQTTTPQVIKPQNHTYKESPRISETYSQAINIVNSFFQSGNKKILVEDYIEGKNFSVWTISDGYKAKTILTTAKYQDEIAYSNPSFITPQLKKEIEEEFINPTINALNSQGEEYVGVLGFDFILSSKNDLYLINYNSFFDDINVDFFTQGFKVNWLELFESVLVGDVFLKYNFDNSDRTKNSTIDNNLTNSSATCNYAINHDNFMLTIIQNDTIEFICAQTKTSLNLYLDELNYDTTLYKEAQKRWKY